MRAREDLGRGCECFEVLVCTPVIERNTRRGFAAVLQGLTAPGRWFFRGGEEEGEEQP